MATPLPPPPASLPPVADPSRPSLMSLTLSGLSLDIKNPLARLKFREKDTGRFTLDSSESTDFVVTFHAWNFDKIKIDIYGPPTSLFRRTNHIARGRLSLKDMEDWHAGTYTRTVTLFSFGPAGSSLAELGTIDAKVVFRVGEGELAALFGAAGQEDIEDEEEEEAVDDDEEEEGARSIVDQIMSNGADTGADDADECNSPIIPNSTAVDVLTLRKASRAHFLRTGTVLSIQDSLERSKKGQPPPPSPISPSTPDSDSKSIRLPSLISSQTRLNFAEVKHLSLGFIKHEFPITATAAVRAIKLLYKFENGLPLPRSGILVRDPEIAARAARFMKHSLSVYGALVVGFCNGKMRVRDNLRPRANEKTAAEYLGLEESDVLFWERTKRRISKPQYYVMHDRKLDAIVVCCEGTISLSQVVTDMNAEYFPVQNGAAHRGILRAAHYIIDEHLKDLIDWCVTHKVSHLYCTGHSLGAGTAALVTILLNEHLEEFRVATGRPDFEIRGHCIATPAITDRALAEPHKHLIDNYVMEHDIVPHLSFGALIAFKEMILEANRLIEAKTPEEACYIQLQAKRDSLREAGHDTWGVIPGRVYHVYKTVRRVPRRHHARLNVKAGLFEEVYTTVDLPPEEKPEVAHYVMEESSAEYFSHIAPRRHLFNHHLPWAYSKGLQGVLEWITEGAAKAGAVVVPADAEQNAT